MLVGAPFSAFDEMLVGARPELLQFPERRFDFARAGTLLLPNDMCSVPATVWDASVVLAMLVDAMGGGSSSGGDGGSSSGGSWAGRTVVELGAGTALPSIVAARLGARVVATDLGCELGVTRRCIAAAQLPVPGEPASLTPAAAMGGCSGGAVMAGEFEWGTSLSPLLQLLGDEGGCGAVAGRVDFVLGADIVYNEEHIEELIQSLLALLRNSSEDGGTGGAARQQTQALISYEQRRRDMQVSFFERLRAEGCACEQLRSPMLDHAAQTARVFIYKVMLAS